MPDNRIWNRRIDPDRRDWLKRWGALGFAGLLPMNLALAGEDKGPGWGQLVVVMLRGGLDGLAAVTPRDDPALDTLRPPGERSRVANLSLSPAFALHPALATLHDWYGSGELLVAHAVASPYRERSHFDAQQLLESGGNRPYELSTGWLGRGLQLRQQGAIALNEALPVALRGAEQAATWTPERELPSHDADLPQRLRAMYANHPQLTQALQQALEQQSMAGSGGGMDGGNPRDGAFAMLARQAGSFLANPKGPRVAWLELGGWDTHNQQTNRLQRMLSQLDGGLRELRAALGPRWATTSVLVMSEFGRTAAFNGTGGTDHGTAGIALLAGGAIAGGRVLADWPGLASAQLFQGRDLRPTRDVRSLIAPLLGRHLGLASAQIEHIVLPGAPPAEESIWRA